jgi:putative transport protein
MIIGQARVEVPTFARTIFFLIFMFGTGYHVGPQFFVTLRRGGGRLVLLSLVFAAGALVTAAGVSWLLGLDPGLAAGLFSGALTQSSVIGTASDAIARLDLPEEQRALLASHVPIADAVTYLFGTIGVTFMLTKLWPRLMRVNLADECRRFEEELGASLDKAEEQAGFEAAINVDVQAFAVSGAGAGQAVSAVEAAGGPRVAVARVRRRGRVFRPGKGEQLRAGDVVVLSGPREDLLRVGRMLGEQVVDAAAMEVPYQTRTVVVTNRRAVGRNAGGLRAMDEKGGQGVHLRRITRQGVALPLLPRTVIERGDVMELVGTAEDLDRVTPLLGVADVPTDKTNFVAMGLTMAIGALVGTLAIRVGGVPVGIGTGGGVLLAGLGFGWLQSYEPRLGRIPGPAVWLMENLGLNAFIAMVALAAGPHAVEAMRTSGVQLLLASVVVATVPHGLAFLVGWRLLRMNAGQLMGALSGAGTITAGLQALVDEAGSSVPVLGYTVPYAINSILLTACGPVMVAAAQVWAVRAGG